MKGVFVLLCALIVGVQSTWDVLYPASVWVEGTLKATFTVTADHNKDVTFKLEFKAETLGAKVAFEGTKTVTKGTTQTLDIPIPSNAPAGTLKATCYIDGIAVIVTDQLSTITVLSKGISVFIQTDKLKYKPGQKVQYRAFATDPDLKPSCKPMDISIYDGKKNKIKQLRNQTSDSCVVSGDLELSDEPVMGSWKIHVDSNGIKGERTFEVEKYVLPKFEVTVIAPGYQTDYETLPIKVQAKYTFGENVIGRVSLHLFYNGQKYEEKNAIINGEKEFFITASTVKGYLGERLVGADVQIKATVTEDVSGITQEAGASVTYYGSDVALSVPPQSDNYFKPGLDYWFYVEATRPDKTPLYTLPDKTKHQVRLEVTYNVAWNDKEKIPAKTFAAVDVPPTGLVTFKLEDIPSRTSRITAKAVYVQKPAVSVSKTVKKFDSKTAQSLQATPLSAEFKENEDAEFVFRSTNGVSFISYIVRSRGDTVYFGQQEVTPSCCTTTTKFIIPKAEMSKMMPSATIIVYSLVKQEKDGKEQVEFVADTYPFTMDQVFRNKVKINFEPDELELLDVEEQKVKLNLEAHGGSALFITVVDKSVQLLGSGDITEQMVLDELATYNTGKSNNNGGGGGGGGICRGCLQRRKRSMMWPGWWSHSGTSADAVQNAGMRFITDAIFSTPSRGGNFGRFVIQENVRVPMAAAGAESNLDSAVISSLAPVTNVRMEFPETWLWVTETVGADGKAVVEANVPDTITSWAASAFGMHPTAGFGLSDTSMLTTFKKLFVKMNLPSFVKMDEEFVLNIVVYNYQKSPSEKEVKVTLKKSSKFKVRDSESNSIEDQTPENKQVVKTVKAKYGVPKAVNIWVVASDIGNVAVEVSVQTNTDADAIVLYLPVEPKGTRKTGNIPIFIEVKPESPASDILVVTLPTVGLVPGSVAVEFQAIGDLMGPAIQNLDKLLRMPSGCGEQNMLNFAPAISIKKYLKASNQLSKAIEDKTMNIMNKGYQREMTYFRDDNSFSAFGKSDESGSTWLTAFVLKCFYQAKDDIEIDESVLTKAGAWLKKQVKEDGKVVEPGRVIHTDMQGGSAKGLGLAAYVVLSMLEGRPDAKVTSVKATMASTIALLETEGPKMTVKESYLLSIVTYALCLAKSPVADQLLTKLNDMAKTDPLLKAQLIDGFGGKKEVDAQNKGKFRYTYHQPVSKDVEQGSYLLLSLVCKGDVEAGRLPSRWLASMRNAEGGYGSTQDTVMGIQALAEYAQLVSGSGKDITVKVNDGKEEHSLMINTANAAILQTIELPDSTKSVEYTATGSGSALIQLSYRYNVDVDPSVSPVDMTITTNTVDEKTFRITACMKWKGTEDSGMGLLEMDLPSGFSALTDSTKKSAGVKRVDVDQKGAKIYMDEFTTGEQCVQLEAEQTVAISNLQPTAVHAYPYYKPEEKTTSLYTANKLVVEKPACEMCPDCNGCGDVSAALRPTSSKLVATFKGLKPIAVSRQVNP